MVKTGFEVWQQNSVTITLGLQQGQFRDRSQQLRGAASSKFFEFDSSCVVLSTTAEWAPSPEPEDSGEEMPPCPKDGCVGYPSFVCPELPFTLFLIKDTIPQPHESHCDFYFYIVAPWL